MAKPLAEPVPITLTLIVPVSLSAPVKESLSLEPHRALSARARSAIAMLKTVRPGPVQIISRAFMKPSPHSGILVLGPLPPLIRQNQSIHSGLRPGVRCERHAPSPLTDLSAGSHAK